MKARLTEQYDVTLSKPEMGELMLALRVFVREFDSSPLMEDVLASLEEVYQGSSAGLGVSEPIVVDDDDEPEGGSAVPTATKED